MLNIFGSLFILAAICDYSALGVLPPNKAPVVLDEQIWRMPSVADFIGQISHDTLVEAVIGKEYVVFYVRDNDKIEILHAYGKIGIYIRYVLDDRERFKLSSITISSRSIGLLKFKGITISTR